MTYKKIREMFRNFYNSKGYKTHKPSTINCYDGDTLFTIAGMKQFSRFYLGEPYNEPHLLTIQPCIRVDDLSVIETSNIHSSSFEMLGAFSFKQINKEFAINNMLGFFESVGINRSEIIATTHINDDESFKIWTNLLGNKVIRLESNFWAMGEYGVCGPCTEVYYNVKNLTNLNEIKSLIENSSQNMIEIGNSVFMSYNRTINGLELLKETYLDMGLGLGRIACVLNKSFNIYTTDIQVIHELLQENKVVTDSIITACRIMKEGIEPGNTGRQYVLRKLIRRALFHNSEIPIGKILNYLSEIYEDQDFIHQKEFIINVIEQEKKLFEQILLNSKKLLQNSATAEDFAILNHTHGVPLEIIHMHVNNTEMIDQINLELEKHKQKSKAYAADTVEYNIPTICSYYTKNECISTVVYVEQRDNDTFIVTEESCFYPRGGGQAGDQGTINHIVVKNTTKKNITFDKMVIIHQCEKYDFKVGDKVHMKIDVEYRQANTRAHSALHLVGEYIMRKLDCKQKGSNVQNDEARIDLSALKSEIALVIDDAIKYANQAIAQAIPSNIELVPIEQAANSLKDGEYGEIVRRVQFGEYSDQLCGGTHVLNTKDIGNIKLKSYSTKAAGITRVSIRTYNK